LVLGEPGIGKTRLADEVAGIAAARGLTIAWGRAWETGGAPPFYPWLEVLEALGGEASGAPRLNEARPRRGETAATDPGRERFALFDEVLRFLSKRSQLSPLLLIFDDLHAADLPTLELLYLVSRQLRSRKIVVIGTLRDLEAERAPVARALARLGREATRLTLSALGSEDVGKLVAEHTGCADARLAAEISSKTEGNPLFVAEALRMRDQCGVAGPSGVLAAIASRIDGLDPETASLLDAASVFGRRINAATIAIATSTPLLEVTRRLSDLGARGVLRSNADGSYVFSHALVRDAFYERVSCDRRRALHLALANTLSADGQKQAALVAHHLLAALPLSSAHDVVRAAIVAAEVARARSAPEDAVSLLERTRLAIVELGAAEPHELELLLALGWAATEAGELGRGRQVFREASRRATALDDATLLARAALGQGAELVFGEVRDELIVTLRSALAGLDETAPVDLRSRVLARLAAALQPSTTPQEPIDLACRAMAMADQVVDERARAEVALAAGSALADFAPPADRIPVSQGLVRAARGVDDAGLELAGLTRLATDWVELGDFARAEHTIDDRAEVAARIGHPRYLWQTPLLRSMLAMAKGDFALCDESIEQARVIGQEGLDANAAQVIARHRFWMSLLRSDRAGLHAALPDTLQAMRRMPEPDQHYALVKAVVQAHSGDAAQARETLAGIGDGARMRAPMMLATIASVALLADDTARFADLLVRLTPARGRNTAWGPFAFVCGPPYDGVVGSLLWRVGRRDEAQAAFDAALALARRSGAAASVAWLELALARARGGPVVPALVSRPARSSEPSAPPSLAFSVRVDSKEVLVECNGRTTRLRSLRGLPILARLLEHPGRELHVLDLAAGADEAGAVPDGGDAGEVLDARARAHYQKRVVDLRAELDEAERFADIGRADRARRELDMLIQQLSNAVGLGGRARRAGSAAERARVTVQRRVREAIKKISEHEPELGRHLDWTIRTGTYCAYEPRGRNSAG
jgi:tetratricopeptide (TPR) repeat protein